MHVQNKEKKYFLKIQPRIQIRKYVYEYYGYVVDENNKEHPFAKGGGIGLEKEEAKSKAIGETIERFCSTSIKEKRVWADFKTLKFYAINPKLLIKFHRNQYNSNFLYHKFKDNIKIYWNKGYSLINKRSIFVPSAVCYLYYYQLENNEPRMFLSTSNGLAAGPTNIQAILSAILELIERDAIMLSWYIRRSPCKIKLETIKSDRIQFLISELKKEGLIPVILLMTLDIPVPVILTILYSKKNLTPYATFGGAADFNLDNAILKALLESIMLRNTLEILYNDNKLYNLKNKKDVKSFLDHGIFYSYPTNKKYWEFLLKGPEKNYENIKEYFSKIYNTLPVQNNYKAALDFLKNHLLKINKNNDIVVVNLTKKIVRDLGFKVVRVIIPALQPIDVRYDARCLGGIRLKYFLRKNKCKLNNAPHPLT